MTRGKLVIKCPEGLRGFMEVPAAVGQRDVQKASRAITRDKTGVVVHIYIYIYIYKFQLFCFCHVGNS